MKDMEKVANLLNSREGSRMQQVSGTDLHLQGPTRTGAYIKKSKKRNYEPYSNNKKETVELQLTPLAIDIGNLKQSGKTTRNDQHIGSLILP